MNKTREPRVPPKTGQDRSAVDRKPGLLRRRHRAICLALLFLVLLCVAAHLRVYLSSPTGRFPVLDGAENFSLARQVASGSLPHQPFFRAMLYPAFLAVFLMAGFTTASLPIAAGLSGCLFHLGSTFCIYFLARRAWASARAGVLAALLFGLHPVALYFAPEPLDTTMGLFLFLAGLNLLHHSLIRLKCLPESRVNLKAVRRLLAAFGCGVFLWVLAMLARPHYAIVLAGFPVLLTIFFWRYPRLLLICLAIFALVAGAALGVAGLVQKKVCGEFRIMPTQGAYSLWVGNRPGANGRYYEQQLHFDPGTLPEGENPARVESEVLYRRETGEQGPINVNGMNHYWREKTRAAVRADPAAWLQLTLRKVYYLFNNFEQYNNKTFAVQKQLSPVLKFNPLGWGLLLILCATGWTMALMARRHCFGVLLATGVAALYAGGVILFFVSDRFRLPLVPFLCVGAGAWGSVRPIRLLTISRSVILVVVAAAIGLLSFSRVWGVYDMSAAIQDFVLLSSAAGKAGEDLEGLHWARVALSKSPENPDALACAVTSFYNSKLQGGSPERDYPQETWALQASRVRNIARPSSGVRLVGAVALWKTGEVQEAQQALRSLAQSTQAAGPAVSPIADDALGILLLTGSNRPEDLQRARDRGNETHSFYLLAALLRNDTDGRTPLSAAQRQTAKQAEPFIKNIFP